MMMAATELAPRLLLPFVARASSLPINMVAAQRQARSFRSDVRARGTSYARAAARGTGSASRC
jgi:hypothetical protein